MFKFEVGKPMKVYRSGNFVNKNGDKGGFIICRECDNQPTDIERPSKSRKPIKFWLPALPEAVCNDGYITFDKILGGEWKSVPQVDNQGNRMKDRNGNDIFNDELVLIVEGLAAFEMPKDADKVKPKK